MQSPVKGLGDVIINNADNRKSLERFHWLQALYNLINSKQQQQQQQKEDRMQK